MSASSTTRGFSWKDVLHPLVVGKPDNLLKFNKLLPEALPDARRPASFFVLLLRINLPEIISVHRWVHATQVTRNLIEQWLPQRRVLPGQVLAQHALPPRPLCLDELMMGSKITTIRRIVPRALTHVSMGITVAMLQAPGAEAGIAAKAS